MIQKSTPFFTEKDIKENRETLKKKYSSEKVGGKFMHEFSASKKFRHIKDKYLQDKGAKILDCGTASGKFLEILYKEGYGRLYASDIEDYRLFKEMNEFKTANFSYDKLPWSDDFFDALTAWEVVEHLENPFNFFHEAKRVLKPDGVFIISMPNGFNLFSKIIFFIRGVLPRWHEENDHITFLSKGVLAKTLFRDFRVAETIYFKGRFSYRFLRKIPLPENEWFGDNVIYVLKSFNDGSGS